MEDVQLGRQPVLKALASSPAAGGKRLGACGPASAKDKCVSSPAAAAATI